MIVEETLEAGASVARIAMKHGVNANQVFKWKRPHEAGSLVKCPHQSLRLLPIQVAEDQQAAVSIAATIPGVGSIPIVLYGGVRIRLEGHVDAAIVRLVLRSLRP